MNWILKLCLPVWPAMLGWLAVAVNSGGMAQVPSAGADPAALSSWGARAQWGYQGDGTYRNPVLPADYSDLDCIRVGADYYAISTTFQFSPGVVILHSRDLVNWTIAGHAVADLTQIGPELNWDRMNRYGHGIWAGAIRFHQGKFRIYFATPNKGYFLTSAPDIKGPWTPLHALLPEAGWDDCCPFWDDDGQGWLVGSNFAVLYKIHLWKLTVDGCDLVRESDPVIYQSKGSEANKLYKMYGLYYHFFSEVHPEGRVIMMERANRVAGPYAEKQQLKHADRAAMEPNQGGFVDGPDAAGISSRTMAGATGRGGRPVCCRSPGALAGQWWEPSVPTDWATWSGPGKCQCRGP